MTDLLRLRPIIGIIMGMVLLTEPAAGSSVPVREMDGCNVVLEEQPGLTCDRPVQTPQPGQDVCFTFFLSDEYEITDVSYHPFQLNRGEKPGEWRLDLYEIRYSQVVTVQTKRTPYSIRYYANGGHFTDGDASDASSRLVSVRGGHLRGNTLRGTEMLAREGYTLESWNTKADGSGIRIGLGSRIAIKPGCVQPLYAIWKPWTDPDCFITREERSGLAITGFRPERLFDGCEKPAEGGASSAEMAEAEKEEDPALPEIVIPEEIDGKPVVGIEEGAFSGACISAVCLPATLRKVGLRAFENSSLESVTLYDTLQEISDYSFDGCRNLKTLYINAVKAPVYSGTYYDTFPDKYDYLLSLAEKRKIVLFSGSSTRFGYDSEKIREAFDGYEVVNMGVFAYTNALPQLNLIRPLMREGDILLHSPEFDAAKRQFCTTERMDDKFFCMTEANYDLVSLLDLRNYSNVFSAFATFLKTRNGMGAREYDWNAAEFDENGNPVMEKSYNIQGDYILFRENAATDAPVYGLPVDYTVAAFPEELYIRPLNRVLRSFLDQKVKVFVTYAPRNKEALSAESTKEERSRLDSYFREKLEVPVISDIEDSLFPGHLLYGTDNHLSTEGVKLRTERIIRDLKTALAAEINGEKSGGDEA